MSDNHCYSAGTGDAFISASLGATDGANFSLPGRVELKSGAGTVCPAKVCE